MNVSRAMVERLGDTQGMNTTAVMRYAMAKLGREVLLAYELDDRPLTATQLQALQADVKEHGPKGRQISHQALLT